MSGTKFSFPLFFKGFLMGLADLIPGISGGTMALLTGIYTPFIDGLSALTSLFHGRASFSPHRPFLLTLGAGIIVALLTGIKGMHYALTAYPGPTYSLFTGLILFSLHRPLRESRPFSFLRIGTLISGMAAAFFLSGLPVQESASASPLLFFPAGLLAVTAMMLPGISGSFILLLLGLYGPVIRYSDQVLSSLFSFLSGTTTFPLLPFFSLLALFSGIALGLLTVSKGIKTLLHRVPGLTMAFLTGFILGALRKPFSLIRENFSGDRKELLVLIIFLIIGGAIALILNDREKKRDYEKSRP
ncbi:MAG TPA: DUF368 domain-containing protein [Firmicutes bacterium]|nr:DUF368 domain-containing protein [Bacillota bacterium]